MGINVRNSYWCKDSFFGIPALAQCMSRDRFKFLLRRLHLASVTSVSKQDHITTRALISILQLSFALSYSPSQEFVVDELMIKSRGA